MLQAIGQIAEITLHELKLRNGMMKDPTEFRERFQRWKNGEQVYEYGLPKFEGGKDRRKVDWKRWDNAELTSYSVPFVEDRAVRLTNAGVATGAILSTNLLDSIADNAERAGLPLETALGLGVKESTLGNPTDDRSAFRISSGIRNAFGGKYPGTEQHINYWHDALNERDDVINYHKGRQSDDPNSKRKSVLQEAFEFYRQHPDKYNPGQKDYQQMVNKRAKEIMQSPEVRRWKNAYDTRKRLENSMWNRTNPLLNPSKFNLPKFEGGKEPDVKLPRFGDGNGRFRLKKTPEYVQAGKDNSWSKVTNDAMGAVFQDVVARPSRTGGNTSVGNWKRQWGPKREKGLEIVSPEFDLISLGMGGLKEFRHLKQFKRVIKNQNTSGDQLRYDLYDWKGVQKGRINVHTYDNMPEVGYVESKIPGGSRALYDAVIEDVTSRGMPGLYSGRDLLSAPKTYSVWKHYADKQLIGRYGTHSNLRMPGVDGSISFSGDYNKMLQNWRDNIVDGFYNGEVYLLKTPSQKIMSSSYMPAIDNVSTTIGNPLLGHLFTKYAE